MISKEQRELLHTHLSTKEIEGLDYALSSKDSEIYFFQTKKDLKWFVPLQLLGYMNPLDAPHPKETEKGLFSLPTWPILYYLGNAAELMSKDHNSPYRQVLFEFIRSVTTTGVNNPTTYYYFLKILEHFALCEIPSDISVLLKNWLKTGFKASMVDAELCSSFLPKMLDTIADRNDLEKLVAMIDALVSFETVSDPYSISGDRKKARLFVTPYWFKNFFSENTDRIVSLCGLDTTRLLQHRLSEILSVTAMEVSGPPILHGVSIVFHFDGNDIKVKIILANGTVHVHSVSKKCSRVQFISSVIEILKRLNIQTDKNTTDVVSNAFLRLHDSLTWESSFNWRVGDTDDAADMVAEALLIVLRQLVRNNDIQLPLILREMFKDNFLIFPKLALHCIALAHNSLDSIFWDALKGDNGDILIEDIFFGDEIRQVFQNFNFLTPTQAKDLVQLIENGSILWGDEYGDTNRKLWKQARYEALARIPELRTHRDHLYQDTGKTSVLRPAVSISVGGGYEYAPYQESEQKISESTSNLDDIISPAISVKDEGASSNALAKGIPTEIRHNPSIFVTQLNQPQALPYTHFLKLITGFQYGLTKLSVTELEAITLFVDSYTRDDRFWNDQYPVLTENFQRINHLWTLPEIGFFFSDALKKRKDVTVPLIDKIQCLLLRLLQRFPLSDSADEEPISHALNSPGGRLLNALFIAEFSPIKVDAISEMHKETRSYLDEQINEAKPDALTLSGWVFAAIFKKEELWSRALVKKVEEFSEQWIYFIIGYLQNPGINHESFTLMSPLVLRAIQSEDINELHREQLVRCIAIAYLHQFDKGLFEILLDRRNPEELGFVVQFFWHLGKPENIGKPKPLLSLEHRKLILAFWDKLVEVFSLPLDIDEPTSKLLSATSLLLIHLPTLERESRCRIMLAAEHVATGHYSAFFLEYLDHSQKALPSLDAATIVRDSLKEMVKHELPIFDKAHLRSLVSFLTTYEETRRDAYDICSSYAKAGHNILEDIGYELRTGKFQKPFQIKEK